MNQKGNDNLPRLLYWIADNREGWKKICLVPDVEQDDFVETLQSLREAGLYQIALVLIVTTCHRRFLNNALKDIMLHWCGEKLSAEAIDGFIGLPLEKLE